MMKRIFSKPSPIVVAAALLLIAVASFIAVRAGRARPTQVRPPHTVFYKLTSYNEAGEVVFRSTVHRTVTADGVWRQIQILQDGRVYRTSGRVKGPRVKYEAPADAPEILGYKVVQEDTAVNKTWISPELQEDLKYVSLYPDGKVLWTREAVAAQKF